MRAEIERDWNPSALRAEQQRRRAHERHFAAWGAVVPWPDSERWPVPESSWALPTR